MARNTALYALGCALACATLHGAGKPLEMAGQIMMIADTSPRRLHLLVHGSRDGYSVWDLTEPKAKCASGDIVRIQGFQDKPTSAILREQPYPVANYATNITVLSGAELPKTVPASAQLIASPEGIGRLVEAGGTVVSIVRDSTNAAWNWLIIQTDTGEVRAAATGHDYPYGKLHGLLDAEIRIRGSVHEFEAWRKFLGNHVILYGKDGIEVTKVAGDPFAAPGLDVQTSHRRQVSGTVVGLSSKRIYVRDADGRFISVSTSGFGDLPAVGESVAVSGFVKNGPLGIQLTEAAVRCDGKPKTKLEPAEDVDVERLLAACRDNDIVDASLYGKPVRILGVVANSTEDIAISGRIMLECSRKNILVDIAHLSQDVRDTLETGSKLEVSGICIPEFDADVTNMVFPEFKGLIVIPRAPEDIRILRTPPWWTPGRLFAVIGALLVVLAWIFAWNRMLNYRAERRGRELAEERVAHVTSDLKVYERTRLAVELHDSLSQNLTGVSLAIRAANRLADTDPAGMRRHLGLAARSLDSCRDELRNCLWDLRNRTLEEADMNEAIRQTLAPHIGGTRLSIRFNVPRERLSDNTAHALLRIIRELVSNAIRHGCATEIKVAGAIEDNRLLFSVADNGCGFKPERRPGAKDGHFGLQGIQDRVDAFEGDFTIASAPGSGTKATISIKVTK